MPHQADQPLDTILVGVPKDDLEELYETLRDRRVSKTFLARLLAEYKKSEEADRTVAPFIRRSRALSVKRQRLRRRLLKILGETVLLYETELDRAKKAGVLAAEQSGYRAAQAMLAALEDRHDSILGPEMGFLPKRRRGPRERPEKTRLRTMLRAVGLEDQATFLIEGLFPAKKKK